MLSLAIPVQLLLILGGLLFSVVVVGYLARSNENDTLLLERFDRLLLGLLLVAAFAMVIFLTVMLTPSL